MCTESISQGRRLIIVGSWAVVWRKESSHVLVVGTKNCINSELSTAYLPVGREYSVALEKKVVSDTITLKLPVPARRNLDLRVTQSDDVTVSIQPVPQAVQRVEVLLNCDRGVSKVLSTVGLRRVAEVKRYQVEEGLIMIGQPPRIAGGVQCSLSIQGKRSSDPGYEGTPSSSKKSRCDGDAKCSSAPLQRHLTDAELKQRLAEARQLSATQTTGGNGSANRLQASATTTGLSLSSTNKASQALAVKNVQDGVARAIPTAPSAYSRPIQTIPSYTARSQSHPRPRSFHFKNYGRKPKPNAEIRTCNSLEDTNTLVWSVSAVELGEVIQDRSPPQPGEPANLLERWYSDSAMKSKNLAPRQVSGTYGSETHVSEGTSVPVLSLKPPGILPIDKVFPKLIREGRVQTPTSFKSLPLPHLSGAASAMVETAPNNPARYSNGLLTPGIPTCPKAQPKTSRASPHTHAHTKPANINPSPNSPGCSQTSLLTPDSRSPLFLYPKRNPPQCDVEKSKLILESPPSTDQVALHSAENHSLRQSTPAHSNPRSPPFCSSVPAKMETILPAAALKSEDVDEKKSLAPDHDIQVRSDLEAASASPSGHDSAAARTLRRMLTDTDRKLLTVREHKDKLEAEFEAERKRWRDICEALRKLVYDYRNGGVVPRGAFSIIESILEGPISSTTSMESGEVDGADGGADDSKLRKVEAQCGTLEALDEHCVTERLHLEKTLASDHGVSDSQPAVARKAAGMADASLAEERQHRMALQDRFDAEPKKLAEDLRFSENATRKAEMGQDRMMEELERFRDDAVVKERAIISRLQREADYLDKMKYELEREMAVSRMGRDKAFSELVLARTEHNSAMSDVEQMRTEKNRLQEELETSRQSISWIVEAVRSESSRNPC
ncbi:hypothetical protein BU17DRAFT_66292 [Hysterangium stoloniferum]|nr:hypothetical protein BU17DRAFT_66292 [Hysterangium stoloniferum]